MATSDELFEMRVALVKAQEAISRAISAKAEHWTNFNEIEAMYNFAKEHYRVNGDGLSSRFKLEFTPCAVGTGIKIRSELDNAVEDVSDYGSW